MKLQGGADTPKCVAKCDYMNLISVPGGRRRPVPSAFHDEADDDGEEEKLGEDSVRLCDTSPISEHFRKFPPTEGSKFRYSIEKLEICGELL